MTPENRFNLIDEPWIPVADVGQVSLKQVFSDSTCRALGGNPVQKIALTKLLLAIAQAACTPQDDQEWVALGATGMAEKCLTYLDKWHDRFWLYGEKPFLQMPKITELIKQRTKELKEKAGVKNNKLLKAEASGLPKPFGAGFYPDLPAENNTFLTQNQFDRVLSDAEKTLFIVSLMNFAFGGKRIEKNLPPLSSGYSGKTVSAKPGPSLGNYVGYLHSYLIGGNLLESIWINLLSNEQIKAKKYWKSGLGIPPWENMPSGESCEMANKLKNSYLGCLVALSRFVTLNDTGIFYVEGIQYPSHKDGWREPSMAIDDQGDGVKALWVDPNKRPWRELTALLSFIESNSQRNFNCLHIAEGLKRLIQAQLTSPSIIGVWSGGIRVSRNSGDQSIKRDNDFVESFVLLDSTWLGEWWYVRLKKEMAGLDDVAKKIYATTLSFFKEQKMEGKDQAARAGNLFWQLCERHFQSLVNACGEDTQADLRKTFARFAQKSYDTFCPKDTARQLEAWAKNRPDLSQYLAGKFEPNHK